MKIINKTKNTVVAQKARIADTFLSRLVGLLNKSSISPEEALVIARCQSIHMFFMRFAIDAIFVNTENKVVGLVEGIGPFKLSPIFLKASYVIELSVGTITRTQTSLGDWLLLQEES